jgi:hypothetical protein
MQETRPSKLQRHLGITRALDKSLTTEAWGLEASRINIEENRKLAQSKRMVSDGCKKFQLQVLELDICFFLPGSW